jgi:hypothetical protein
MELLYIKSNIIKNVIPANAGISKYFYHRQEMSVPIKFIGTGMTMFFTVNVFYIGE